MKYSRTRWGIYAMIFAMALLVIFAQGCATTSMDELEREFARVEYIESEFKPWLAGCRRGGGFPWYNGAMSPALRKAMDDHFHTYEGVKRSDLIGFRCASKI